MSATWAEREHRRQLADAALAEACFIDKMRPITPGEHLGWGAYLRLPQPSWRAARDMFRRAFNGDEPETNLMQFLTETHVDDASLVSALEVALSALWKECELYRRWTKKRGR
jgi:hypothetical protein